MDGFRHLRGLAYRACNGEQQTGFKTGPKTPSLLLKIGVFSA
jgi:hypothetical protein